jgi:hypothetical protein
MSLLFFLFQVPEKYICGTCKNPRLGRRSQLHNLDHDWMKEGLLPTPSSSSTTTQPSAELQLLSRLMSELSALSSLLHSLQVKLSVAEQATHPKVFMWSSPWEDGVEEEGEEWSSLASHEPPPSHPFLGRHNDHDDFTHMEMGGSNSDPVPVSCDSGGESSDATRRCGTEGDQTKSGGDCSVLLSSAENPPVSQSHESGSVDPFSFFDFPSLNEVKQLLPSVLKDISSMEELGGAAVATAAAPLSRAPPPPVAVNIIPEPKLINREESRLNLIGHIEHLQELLDGRLDLVEQRLNELELLPQQQQQQTQQQQQQPQQQQQQPQQQQQQPQQQPQQQQQQQPGVDCANIAQAVSRLLTDIQSMKTVNAMLSDRI